MRSLIIVRQDHPVVCGTTFNVFEYFYTAWCVNKDVHLWFIGSDATVDYIFKVFKDRYHNLDWSCRLNVRAIKRSELVRQHAQTIFVTDYTTIELVRGILRCDELLLMCEKNHHMPQYQFNPKCYNLIRYSEMPFNEHDISYTMKLGFHMFEPLEHSLNGYYLNAPKHPNPKELISELSLPEETLVKTDKHVDNFFGMFSDYVYVKTDYWFDSSPRMILECAFYGKEIHYYNTSGTKDGSWYRYQDFLVNGLTNRHLDERDEIIQRLTI